MKQSKNHCISVTHKRIKKGIVRFKWPGKGLSQNDLHILLQFINGKIHIFIQICLTLFTNGFLCLMKGLTRDILMSDNVDLWNMLYLWLVVGVIRKLCRGHHALVTLETPKMLTEKVKRLYFFWDLLINIRI